MFTRRFAAVFTISLITASFPAFGETDEQTIARLTGEIALLKMKLKDAEKKIAAHNELDSPTQNAADEPKLFSGPAITDLADLLKRLPPEAQPNRGGQWTKSAAAEADTRLKYSFWGTPFKNDLEIEWIKTSPNEARLDDANAASWKAEIKVKGAYVNYRGKKIIQYFQPLTFYYQDAELKVINRLEPQQKVHVIAEVETLQPNAFRLDAQTPQYYFHLRNVELPGLGL